MTVFTVVVIIWRLIASGKSVFVVVANKIVVVRNHTMVMNCSVRQQNVLLLFSQHPTTERPKLIELFCPSCRFVVQRKEIQLLSSGISGVN